MFKRSYKSKIILSIIPHLTALFYTVNNFFYSSIIITSTVTSIIWHRNKEPNNILLLLDYGTASVLSFYEVYNSYSINNTLLIISLLLNLYVLMFNKVIYFLSKEKVISYSLWHTFYHILSSVKTTCIAFLCYHRLSE
jgi:hypothetical protein